MANRYWVGNGGNWNDNTNHWAASSGGAPGASLPGSSDNVFFDANSFSSGSQTVTINVGATFLSMNWTGALNTPTLAGSSPLNCYGSLTLISGMTITFTGDIVFYASGLSTFATAGKTLSSHVLFGVISAGTYGITGGLNVGASHDIYHNNGTLNLGSNTITCRNFYTNGSITRTLQLSTTTLNCAQFIAGGSGLTVTTSTSTINCTASSFTASFSGAGKTYSAVTLTGQNLSILGANTFASLSVTGAAVKTGVCAVADDLTVTGALSIQGNSAVNRILFHSGTAGTTRAISAGSIGTLANVDFRDINANGAAIPWTGTSLGDCEGNSDITLNTPTTRYWVNGDGTWSDTAQWSTSSGGSSGASVPLPQDNVIFDSNSGMTGFENVTIDMGRLGKDITLSTSGGFTIDLAQAFNEIEIYGSLLVTQTPNFGPSFFVNLDFVGRGSNTISVPADFYLTGFLLVGSTSNTGGTVTANSDFKSVGFDLYGGTFNLNGYTWTVDAGAFSIDGGVFNCGSGIIVIDHSASGIGNFTYGAGTFNRDTGTIWCKAGTSGEINFVGGNQSYYRLKITGDTQIYAQNTFYILEIDAPAKTIKFPAGDTQTIESNMLGGGNVTDNAILQSSAPGNPWYLTKSSGIILVEYVTLSDSHVSGGASWRAGQSVDDGGNDGWSFIISKVLTETITITATIRNGGRKIIADTMTLLDTLTRSARKILIDVSSIIDVFAIINYHITLYETIVVNEIFSRTVRYTKAIADTIGMSEIFTRVGWRTIRLLDQLKIRELPRLALNGIVTAFWSRVAKDQGTMTKVAKDDGSGYTKVAKDGGGATLVAKDTPDWTLQNKDY